MAYIDGMVCSVRAGDKAKYEKHIRRAAELFKKHGALSVTETWGNEVPDGEVTSFPMAVKRQDDEVVVFSWIMWPSKEAHDAGWKAVDADPEMGETFAEMPFDGKRMIYGGFDVILQA